jgi:hypothetical protein
MGGRFGFGHDYGLALVIPEQARFRAGKMPASARKPKIPAGSATTARRTAGAVRVAAAREILGARAKTKSTRYPESQTETDTKKRAQQAGRYGPPRVLFILHPSSFILHPSLHPSALIPHVALADDTSSVFHVS